MDNDRKIKILLVTSYYPPEHTGAGLRAHRTFQRLSEKYPIDVLAVTRNRGKVKEHIEIYDGVRVLRIKTGNSLLSYIYNTGRAFYMYDLKSYDIVYCNGDVYIHLAAGLWALIFSRKLIMEVVKNKMKGSKNFMSKLRSTINYIRFGYLREKINTKSHLSVALNNQIRDYFINIGIPLDKIWLRPNPVDTRIFYPPSEEQRNNARRSYKIKENNFVHLLLGIIKERKNQKFAIDYIRGLPKHHILIIAGPIGDLKYYDDIKKMIIDYNLHEKVILIADYQYTVNKLYHASDMLIIPSFSEGTPNVMLEALCCGLPVLINKELGLDEYIMENINGWSIYLSVDEFISKSLQCELKYSEYSERLKIAETSKRKYAYEFLDDNLFQHIRELLINNKHLSLWDKDGRATD
jgi:glycosyltransferase involved in cell wall biosynthesis